MNDLATTTSLIQQPADEAVIQMWLHGRPHHTRRAYEYDVAKLRAFVNCPLAQVTLQQLQAYVDSMTGADRTKARSIAIVKSLFTFGHRLGYLPFNTAAVIRSQKIENGVRAERILSEAETLKMLDLEPPGRNKVMLRFLYASGMRVSELVSLRWRDFSPFDEHSGVVTLTGKGNKVRAVNIPDPVWSEVMALRKDADRDAKPFGLNPTTVWDIVRAAAKRAEIQKPVSTHWLRHACGTHTLENGGSLTLVQHQFGHASLATTGQYLHARPGEGAGKFLKL